MFSEVLPCLSVPQNRVKYLALPNAQSFTCMCDVATMTEQSSLDALYNWHCIQCKVGQMSPRCCEIYRHACQDQESLSSTMAIAKCVEKTCVAAAGFHHAGCLRKHFQKDIVSVSACVPALSCCHPTVNGYLSWQGWIWQPLPATWIQQHSQALHRVNYALNSEGINLMRVKLLGGRLAYR